MRNKLLVSILLVSTCLGMQIFSASSYSADRPENQETEYSPTQDNLVYLNTQTGLVVIELTSSIAPNHVAQFKALVDEGFYNGLDFYRVIDGFVAQAGDETKEKPSSHGDELKAEFVRSVTQASDFIVVQSPEFLAQQTGFIQGFPAGRSNTDKQEWLLHCPGVVAMARDIEADSGSTDFYIVIGQAPRHLDRNMSVFGRVIYGMQNVQAMQRGNPNIAGGVIEDASKRNKIVSAMLGHKIPKAAQLRFTRSKVTSEAFQERLSKARNLSNPFFHYKGTGQLDVCYYRPTYTLDEEFK